MTNETDLKTEDPNGNAPKRDVSRSAVRWLGIALVLSLSLNLLFVGFAATRFAHDGFGRHHGGMRMGMIAAEGRRFMRDLPRERRHELRDLVRQNRAEFKSGREAMKDAARDFANALRTEPLDRAALDRAIETLRMRAGELLTQREKVTLQVVLALTPDERLAFADRLIDRLN